MQGGVGHAGRIVPLGARTVWLHGRAHAMALPVLPVSARLTPAPQPGAPGADPRRRSRCTRRRCRWTVRQMRRRCLASRARGSLSRGAAGGRRAWLRIQGRTLDKLRLTLRSRQQMQRLLAARRGRTCCCHDGPPAEGGLVLCEEGVPVRRVALGVRQVAWRPTRGQVCGEPRAARHQWRLSFAARWRGTVPAHNQGPHCAARRTSPPPCVSPTSNPASPSSSIRCASSCAKWRDSLVELVL